MATVLVDRGDGHLFKVTAGDVKKFIAANPGSFLFGEVPVHVSEPDVEATSDTVAPRSPRVSHERARKE